MTAPRIGCGFGSGNGREERGNESFAWSKKRGMTIDKYCLSMVSKPILDQGKRMAETREGGFIVAFRLHEGKRPCP